MALTLIQTVFNEILSALNQNILKIFVAMLIFFFGFILGKLLGRIIYKALEEIELNNFLKNSLKAKINASHLIGTFVSYAIYFFALIASLEQLGIANAVLYIIAAFVVLILLISFFIALREIIPNFISGIYLYSREHLEEGKQIEINEIKGTIMHIDLFHIKIKTKSGDLIYIPNSLAAKSKIKIKR
jgi:small-conductance mechanosensitive channel